MNRIHQKMSLEQKIQTLKKDFLDRDQTTFVKIRRTGRLGWMNILVSLSAGLFKFTTRLRT